jgi:hypothetical protein
MKRFVLYLIIPVICVGMVSASTAAEEKEIPKLGSRMKVDGVWFFVRGVGDKPFEYIAKGDSLAIQTIGIPGSIIIVPKKGAKVRIDPTIPMIWVDGKEDKWCKTNSYFKKHAKNKVFVLLEIDRSKK